MRVIDILSAKMGMGDRRVSSCMLDSQGGCERDGQSQELEQWTRRCHMMSLEDRVDRPDPAPDSFQQRSCPACCYLLVGLQRPARCPECGVTELPQEVVLSGLSASCWSRIALCGPFVGRNAGEDLWTIALHPSLGRISRNRTLSMVLALSLAVLTAALLWGWWVYKVPQQPGDGTYTQRCCWYEVSRQAIPSEVSHGRTPGGEPLVYHYSLGVTGWQIPLCVLELASGQVFYFAFRMFGWPWIFLLFGWPVMCAVARSIEARHRTRKAGLIVASIVSCLAFAPTMYHGMIARTMYPASRAVTLLAWALMLLYSIGRGSETKRGFRMAGLLTVSFGPFLAFVPLLFAAKLAYAFFWIDWRIIQYLFFLHLVLAVWPGLTYARYAMLAPFGRWRRYALAGGTCFVVVLAPIAAYGLILFDEVIAMNWI